MTRGEMCSRGGMGKQTGCDDDWWGGEEEEEDGEKRMGIGEVKR